MKALHLFRAGTATIDGGLFASKSAQCGCALLYDNWMSAVA
ncbi:MULTISPECIES: hypothetical protein [Dickeya]|nr:MULTISPECIES: hypothetical protein [Dickeya]